MTLPASIPQAAIDLVLSLLLPLILPSTGGDTQATRALALQLLADHNPQTARELRLQEARPHRYSLKGLTMLANSAEPGIIAEKLDTALKWACSLSRSGHQAQRRLDELQRPAPRRASRHDCRRCHPAPGSRAGTANPGNRAAAAATCNNGSVAHRGAGRGAQRHVAERLLILMKARHKGAPPPHSPAAQQIQAQQRLVDAARMKLQHARRQPVTPERLPTSLQAAA